MKDGNFQLSLLVSGLRRRVREYHVINELDLSYRLAYAEDALFHEIRERLQVLGGLAGRW